MAEVFVQFGERLTGSDGQPYIARVCGREQNDGLWEGWIEFDPVAGGTALRTPRETTQPKRSDMAYWASGLTAAYLEGALRRAEDPAPPDLRPRTVDAKAAFDGPAEHKPTASAAASASTTAVLNPFTVYAQGEHVLRNELMALDEGHLRNIIRAHALADEGDIDLLAMHRTALAELIVAAVRRRQRP